MEINNKNKEKKNEKIERKERKNDKVFTFNFKEWRDIKDSFPIIEYILKIKKIW